MQMESACDLALQARIMGTFAAQCMHNAMAAEDDRLEAGLNFELFTHVTRFYGKKVLPSLQSPEMFGYRHVIC
jgi:hypothetical protein